jgi:secreted trypsin-like serine protease
VKFLGCKRVRLATLVVAVASVLAAGVATAHGADDPPTVEPHIIGGGAASEPYPFMATLGFIDGSSTDIGHQCGATLVFPGWVLTAAHCVDDPPAGLTEEEQDELSARFGMDLYDHVPSEGTFYVKVGSHDRTDGVPANVTQIKVHEDFNWFQPGKANDIAMLQLDHELDLQPIQLAGAAADPGAAIRLLGWGITEPDTTGPDPIILQELDTTVAHDAECRFGIPGDITDGEICTDNPHGTDGPCFGDSGGPAIEKGADGRWKFVGTTSRGGRWCGTTTAIYTSPPDFRKWIYDTARGVEVTAQPVIPEPRKSAPGYTLPYEPPNSPQPASQERDTVEPASRERDGLPLASQLDMCSHCITPAAREQD